MVGSQVLGGFKSLGLRGERTALRVSGFGVSGHSGLERPGA